MMAAADKLELFKPTPAEATARGLDLDRPKVRIKPASNPSKNSRRKLKKELGHRAVRRAEKSIRSFKG